MLAVRVEDAVASCAAGNQGLVTFGDLVRLGVRRADISQAVALGAVVRVRRRVYALDALPPLPRHAVTADAPEPAHVAHVRAALLHLGPAATACGRTAAVLRGWGLLVEPARLIEIALPHSRSRGNRDGIRVRQRRRLERTQLVLAGASEPLWVTSPVQTVLDCCRELPLIQAVVACDSAIRAGDVRLAELLPYASERRVRQVLALCDPAAGSVLESVTRVRLVLAGIASFRTQAVLAAGPVLRVDFCFDVERLVIEVDGQKWHPDPTVDRKRDNRLAELGWRVLRFTWVDVVHRPAEVVASVQAALHAGTQNIQPGAALAAAAA